MSASAKISPLRHLVNILSDAVARIDEKYESANLEFPTLDKQFNRGDPAWQLLSDRDVVPITLIIVAAANQLFVSARPPAAAVLDMAQSHFISASLRLVCETSVVEILREAGPQGLHVKDIAAKNKQHPDKLARVLRLLATHHVFVEVSPNVFTNSSLSSVMDTGKSSEELFTKPKVDKFKGAAGVCSIVELATDDTMKGSTSLTDALLDPTTSHSEEPSDSPCLRILKTKSYFDYLYAPGNEYQSVRFQVTMDHGASSDNSTVISGGFPWESLPEGTKIVDVGGGVGSACQEIMKKNPLLKFTVQDLPSVIEQANAYWNQYEPKAIEDGRVTIQAHDFFTPQPVKDADIFLLRCILHDWSNSKAIEILKWLREAAIPGKTRVVVMDSIIQHTCAVDWKQIGREAGIAFEGLDGRSEVPAGLLSNLGRAEAKKYLIDLMMLAMFNGQERTIVDHIRVTEASGWKIKKIYSLEGKRISHILAEAV